MTPLPNGQKFKFVLEGTARAHSKGLVEYISLCNKQAALMLIVSALDRFKLAEIGDPFVFLHQSSRVLSEVVVLTEGSASVWDFGRIGKKIIAVFSHNPYTAATCCA